jgi:hypothetical protein
LFAFLETLTFAFFTVLRAWREYEYDGRDGGTNATWRRAPWLDLTVKRKENSGS